MVRMPLLRRFQRDSAPKEDFGLIGSFYENIWGQPGREIISCDQLEKPGEGDTLIQYGPCFTKKLQQNQRRDLVTTLSEWPNEEIKERFIGIYERYDVYMRGILTNETKREV
jgi:hypothetical protein